MRYDGQFKLLGEIKKAYRGEDGRYLIRGVASGIAPDLENERMLESAISCMKRAIDEGIYTNEGEWSLIPLIAGHDVEWDRHLGWVTAAEIDDEHNLVITAELDPDVPNAMGLYRKLTRSPQQGKPLRLGFSVGGKVIEAGEEYDDVNRTYRRVYHTISLREMTVTSYPAFARSVVEALAKSVDWSNVKGYRVAIGDGNMENEQDGAVTEAVEKAAEVGEVALAAVVEATADEAEVVKAVEDETTDVEIVKNEDVLMAETDVAKQTTDEGAIAAEVVVEKTETDPLAEIRANLVALTKSFADLAAVVATLSKSEPVAEAETGVAAASAADEREQVTKTDASADAAVTVEGDGTGDPVTKGKTEATASIDLSEVVKAAVAAAIEPLAKRIEEIEAEPVDKSMAIIPNKDAAGDKVAEFVSELAKATHPREALGSAFKFARSA